MPVSPPTSADAPATRPKWLGPLLVAGVVGLYVLGAVTSAISPKLVDNHPLLLMALNPRYRFMVVAAPKIGLPQFIAVGVARLLLSDPLYFLIGRLYGDRAVQWFADSMGGADRPGNLVITTRNWFQRAEDVLVALACGPIVCVLAGAAKMKWKRFLLLDLVGTTIIVMALRLFSNALRPVILRFLDFNKKHSTALLIVAVVATLFFVVQGASGMRRRVKGLRDLAEGTDAPSNSNTTDN